MDPTTNSTNRILSSNFLESENKNSRRKIEPELLIEVLKKNHLLSLKEKSEVKENSVNNEEIVRLDSEIYSSAPSTNGDVSKSKLRTRVSKYELTKRTSNIVSQRNAERESKLTKTESNVTSVSTSFTCTLL